MTTDLFVQERETVAESIQEGIEILEKDFSFREEQSPLRKVMVTEDYLIVWNGDRLRVTRWAFRSLLRLLKIPENFGLRIPRDLLVENVDRLKHGEDRDVTAFIKDCVIINFVRDSHSAAKSLDVLRLFEKYLDRWSFQSLRLSDQGIELSLIDDRLPSLEPKVGDITKVGWRVINSETGYRGLKASFLLFRLACLNGAVLPKQWGEVRWSYDKRMYYDTSLRKFEEGVLTAFLRFELLRTMYSRLVERPLPDDQFVGLWRSLERVVGKDTADSILGVRSGERQEIFKQTRERSERNKRISTAQPEPSEDTRWSCWDVYNQITSRAKDYDFVTQGFL